MRRALAACDAVADADALLTVFGNLLSNAIRYTPEGGRVEARCGVDDVGLVQRRPIPASG